MSRAKLLQEAPDPETAERYLELLRESHGEAFLKRLLSSPQAPLLVKLLGFSPYAGGLLSRRPEVAQDLLETPFKVSGKSILLRKFLAPPFPPNDFKETALKLRLLKHREILRILALDLNGAPLTLTVRRLTALAEVLLQGALRFLCNLFRIPEKGLLILAFGKFGARELNYSSDLDLAYFYHPHLEKTQVIRLFEYLNRLFEGLFEGERLWRLDLRLRPGGKEGELALSLPAARDYYLYRLHPFERLALIRARPVAGNISLGYSLLRKLRPVIFPRYLDYTYLEHIRDLKERIHRETLRKEAEEDLKTGPGGIREVEFLVQALQSIYGGKHPELRGRGLLPALARLKRLGLLPPREAQELREAYIFLRLVEHRVQTRYFQQTARLPREGRALDIIARSLGFSGRESFRQRLVEIRKGVNHKFEDFLSPACPRERSELLERLSENLLTGEPLTELARCAGLPENLLMDLARLLHVRGPLGSKRSALLRDLLPVILHTVLDQPAKEKALSRTVTYFERLGGRLSLLAAFKERPAQLERLLKLFTLSDFLWRIWESHPELAETLFEPPRFPDENLLRRRLADLSYDEALATLRILKNETLLETAIQHLEGKISVKEVLFRLSRLAELFALFTYEITLKRVQEEWGRPFPGRFAVLAMGKLGSREMGYRSDLDLVFVYEGPLESMALSAKLAQRFLSYLSLRLPGGEGYPVDARLRPEGRKGPLTVPRSGLEHYYRQEADLWELVAAVRLRFLCGDPVLGQETVTSIRRILAERRPSSQEKRELYRMRLYMEKERGKEDSRYFNPKMGRGGLADLEFLAALKAFEILGDLSENFNPATPELLAGFPEGPSLIANYFFLREVEQKLILLYDPTEEDPRYTRENLEALKPWLGEEVRERYREITRINRQFFEKYFLAGDP